MAKRFGCLRDVEVSLTPLHAFVGPNDGGKTTLLRAIETGMNLAAEGGAGGRPKLVHDLFGPGSSLTLHLPGDVHLSYEMEPRNERSTFGEKGTRVWTIPGLYGLRQLREGRGPVIDDKLVALLEASLEHPDMPALLKGARVLRLDSDALRQPSELITPEKVSTFLEQRGAGLPAVLDLILGRGDDSFAEISAAVRKLFPVVKRVGVRPVSNHAKEIEIQLHDGTAVRASRISDGLLYYLAFEVLRHIDPVSVLLIEEPENGLHPARVADVVRVLRDVASRGCQCIIATHSPLLVNELRPEEVSVVTRTEEAGTRVTPIADTANFEDRKKVYALGELWVSYADGTAEAPLFGEEPAEG